MYLNLEVSNVVLPMQKVFKSVKPGLGLQQKDYYRRKQEKQVMDIMGKKILLDKSELLYDKPFSAGNLNEDWDIATGEWWVDDGWLTGRIRENGGGLIYSRNNYTSDILLDFSGRMVPPCTNDLNFIWHAQGWDFKNNDSGIGYIAGIKGWWTGKTGIERYPECNLQATTSILDFEPGRTYHIQAGIVQGISFIFVNSNLVIELKDPDPIDSEKYGKVGFGAFCSYIQVRDLKIYQLATEDVCMQYTSQF